jgi:hypothetical protein
VQFVVVAVIAFTGGLLALALFSAMKLTAIHLAVYGTPLFLLSMHSVDNQWDTAFRVAVFTGAMIAGYYFASFLRVSSSGRAQEVRRRVLKEVGQGCFYAGPVVTFTTILCVYHFWKVGLPILSSDVESQRFALGGSGLFGLPSRMYLYGVYFALAVAIAEARVRGLPLTKSPWVRIAYATLVVTRLVSGFKSGVAQIFLYTVLLAVLSMGGIRVGRYFGRFLLATIAAVIFIFAVGSTYHSYGSSGQSLADKLGNRVTAESATPAWIVINSTPASLGEPRRPIELDLDYFQYRYLSIGLYEPYGFTRLIAARVAGESPYIQGDIAPVTLSASAVLFYQFRWFGLLAAFLLGGLIRVSERMSQRRRLSPIGFAVAASVAEAAIDFISKGELVYGVINWSATCLVLIGISVLSNAMAQLLNSNVRPQPYRGPSNVVRRPVYVRAPNGE